MSAPDDLLVLVADLDAASTVVELINRRQSLQIRELNYRVIRHPEHDSGCFLHADDFCRNFLEQYEYLVVMFDKEGCGRDREGRDEIESDVEERLNRSGWDGRNAAIVMDPELEIWVWSNSIQVDSALGWTGRQPKLREWLVSREFISETTVKPSRPKEAMEAALRIVNKPHSPTIFQELARNVSLVGCVDDSFQKFCATLKRWFP